MKGRIFPVNNFELNEGTHGNVYDMWVCKPFF